MSDITTFEGLTPNIEYSLKGIIKKVERDGEKETKRPIVLVIQIESSGKVCKMSSWDYTMLDDFKKASESRKICEVSFKTALYRDTLSFKITTFNITDKISSLPEEKQYNCDEEANGYKERITELISKFSNENYKTIITKLVLENPEFFQWRAASACHHAFNGGLVMHSYNVCVNAINLANTYAGTSDFVIDYDLLIAGALVHDIGKLLEYSDKGDFTFLGHLMSHLVVGVEMIDDVCDKCRIDKFGNDILKLKHIIISHHGELQYGSPNVPVIPEAWIVHMADENDAGVEGMIESMKYLSTGELSAPIRTLDNGKVFKLF